MRRWIVSISLIVVLALVAGVGHFVLGWWRPTHATTNVTQGGYDPVSEPSTLPEAMTTAHQALDEIEHKVHDYSAVIIKKERVDKALIERDLTDKDFITTVMFAKIREKPFSVYLRFLDRSDDVSIRSVKGREVIYVDGQNDGNMIVHSPGFLVLTNTMRLAPTDWRAMLGEHHPITDIGLANLCRQLIERGAAAGDPSQVKVERIRHARINKRTCTLLEIAYPFHEPKIWGYLARVFLDDEWHFPIRVEVSQLPLDHGKQPQLVEEYTYLDLKLNNGYSDADFDPKNPQYKFP